MAKDRSLARACAIALAGWLAACAPRGGEPSSPPVAGRLETPPSIVLITIDTLRADHLRSYGYHRETSPHLDALAAEGVLFEQAFAPIATTLPSHVSLFSGVYPHQHGITENRFRRNPFGEGGASGLRSAVELLRDDGYRTAAFVSAAPVKRVTGLGAGFDVFEEPRGYETKGASTTDRAIAWVERDGREPFLLWVHLWHPHEPNRPPPPWDAKFPDDEGLERVIEEREIDPERLARDFAPPALRRFLAPGSGRRDDAAPTVDREAVRDMLNRYDGDVAAADREVGRMLEALRARDQLDRSIVVVTADHGQSLGQHDWLPHGRITNDNLRVPLIVRFPPGVVEPPLRVSRVVSLVDVLPTILARFESEASRRFLAQAEGQDVLEGAPLRGWALAQRTSRRRAGWEAGDEYALVTDRFKLVRRASGRDELYDLVADPGERVDVSAEHAEAKAGLRRTLGEVLRRRISAPGIEAGDEDATPSAEHIEALRSLGYVDD
ncbi:MAG TPA: sulfatase [Thermoanaerobaculia bacterium]|nr:sulfatase [Thermoanaerobaculia bacterium]